MIEHDLDQELRAWLVARAPAAAPRELRQRVVDVPFTASAGPRAQLLGAFGAGVAGLRLGTWLVILLALLLAMAAGIVGTNLPRPAEAPPPISNGLLAGMIDGQVYVIGPDGTSRLQITHEVGQLLAGPRFSPDGARVAVAFQRADGTQTIDVVELATGAVRRVTWFHPDRESPLPGSPGDFVWSPDGTELLSAGFLVDVRTGVTRTLDAGGMAVGWSPDGTRLLATDFDGVGRFERVWQEVLVVDRESLERVPLTVDQRMSNTCQACWSPDGSTILLTIDDMVGTDLAGKPRVDAIAPDGTGRRILAQGIRAEGWSLDGRLILVTFADRPAIGVMNPDGSNLRQIATGESPKWSPDGRRVLYFEDNLLFVTNAQGTGTARVTEDPLFLCCGVDWQPLPR
jgi:hypothetical protein